MQKFLYLLILFALVGCSVSPEQNTSVRKELYPDGSLKIYSEYKDSIQHGKYLYYYLDGIIADSANYVGGKVHGQTISFFPSGNVESICHYMTGTVRNAIFYREDGTHSTYSTYNYIEDLMFITEYDEAGGIERLDGDLIFSYVVGDSIETDENISIELLVANPPNCITEVSITETDLLLEKKNILNQKKSRSI